MNIAVVDDLAVGRETLVNYLNEYFSERNMNVTISDFSDAESFVTQFENNKYNIIFFDIYMPGMSGIEAASTVRKQTVRLKSSSFPQAITSLVKVTV